MPKQALTFFCALLTGLPAPASPFGPFREAIVDSTLLTNPWGKAAGDLNGDGQPDLAVATAYNLAIYWYAAPDWTRRVLSSNNGGDDLLIADVDGDGDNDVVSNGYTINWHRNPTRQGGDPNRPWEMRAIWPGGRSHDLSVGDIDGDGRLDVLIRQESGPTKIILQTAADRWTKVDIPQAPYGTGSTLADLDRDGRLDIVANGFWLKQPAAPQTGTWQRHDFAAWGPNSGVSVHDINRDGRPDVFLSEAYKASRLVWFEAPPDPTAGAWAAHVVGNPADHIHRFHLADMDGDGARDVVFAEQHQSPGHRVGVFRNVDGAGGSWEPHIISTTGSHNIALADLGADGDLDIFGVNWRVDTRPRVWINESSPGDTPRPPPPSPAGLTVVAGDGQVTLDWSRAAGAEGYHLYWREGDFVDKSTGARVGGIQPPYVLDRLANDRLHAFAVSAYHADGESPLGPSVTATPRSAIPLPDTGSGSGQKPYLGSPLPIPGTVQAEDFDLGPEGVAYHDVDTLNQGGLYRQSAVDVGSAAKDSGGGHYVGWIGTGEWYEYTVRVAQAGPYRLEARIASPFQNRGFHLEWNGRDISGPIRVPYTDGWHNWRTHAVDLNLPDTGTGILRIHIDTQGFNINYLRFLPKPPSTGSLNPKDPGTRWAARPLQGSSTAAGGWGRVTWALPTGHEKSRPRIRGGFPMESPRLFRAPREP